jgi:hypothetical protein
MVAEFWPLMKFASQRHGFVEDVVGLFKDSCRISVCVTGVVGVQSVFGHVIW